jgi:hypothetical protein
MDESEAAQKDRLTTGVDGDMLKAVIDRLDVTIKRIPQSRGQPTDPLRAGGEQEGN